MNAPHTTPRRRNVRFESIDDLAEEIDRLVAAQREGHLVANGNWTPAQILDHLARFMEFSYEGFPFRASWPVRAVSYTAKWIAWKPFVNWALRTIGSLELVEIDKLTGDVLSFLPITGLDPSSGIGGLALNPGTGDFYLAYLGNLYDLDIDTGAAALIGPTGFEFLGGLAYSASVPEPGAVVLVLCAGLALGADRRRVEESSR